MTTASCAVVFILAILIDWIWGDPRSSWHPVAGMGKMIGWLDHRLQAFCKKRNWNMTRDKWKVRCLGTLLPLTVAGSVWGAAYLLVRVAGQIHLVLGILCETVLIWLAIAPRGLAESGEAIYEALVNKDLELARRRLSMVVGRDTSRLNKEEVVRGGVETIAENIVDAIISPLFYAAIGGAPLAMAYRAVNTLDSMVGYKNRTYLHLGWASARLDDLANWLPARTMVPFMLFALGLLRLSPRAAWKTVREDAHKHPSPNSGIPESLMAGGLQIQLGGVNVYQGVRSIRSRMGKPVQSRRAKHLLLAIRVMWFTTWLYLLAMIFLSGLIHG
ncbi:adenosylcobinamide-phosphate synthase CbiB [Thermoactinomyces mirandus]|uniref:Cobalamin biosynthesis protein CobD n=1 Tax=Thermoactinomyces mirandus TaxID=2756294 RepID=A0A7W2AQ03_9BACL|nr:adenosylcobinamide-phosphate synthase CbiB [Thermoactinomyces mirandus]MBA4601489.1 cobalamin biosynthesis protein CobD [Thermoactinomyces mirandus]